MSSLLQSPGRIERRGVEIFLVLESQSIDLDGNWIKKPPIYRIWRKPAGMCGCWVLFRLSGQVWPLDLSVPHTVKKLPRDAEKLTSDETETYWSS